MAWSDEFDGPVGATVDLTKWTFDIGGGGWGNQELENEAATAAGSKEIGKLLQT